MTYLKDEQTRIELIKSLIENDENAKSSDLFLRKRLARRYKALGDATINLYRDTYAVHQLIRHDLAEISFASFQRAIELFDSLQENLEGIYARFAYGNACKERCLPKMDLSQSQKYLTLAIDIFDQCFNFCFADINTFTQEYFFAQLLQENLFTRQMTLHHGLLPKNIVVFHSLKSIQSRKYLYGLYHDADKNYCEIWEYRLGKVTALDSPKEYIRHRLVECSAVVFIASSDYFPATSEIIKFEIETAIYLKEAGDPFVILVVDLGNREVVEMLRSVATVIPFEESEELFTQKCSAISDIYNCRRYRCERNIQY